MFLTFTGQLKDLRSSFYGFTGLLNIYVLVISMQCRPRYSDYSLYRENEKSFVSFRNEFSRGRNGLRWTYSRVPVAVGRRKLVKLVRTWYEWFRSKVQPSHRALRNAVYSQRTTKGVVVLLRSHTQDHHMSLITSPSSAWRAYFPASFCFALIELLANYITNSTWAVNRGSGVHFNAVFSIALIYTKIEVSAVSESNESYLCIFSFIKKGSKYAFLIIIFRLHQNELFFHM